MNSSSSSDQDTVDRLAEEFVARHRRGEHPDVAEYIDQFPQYAEAIRDLFPALVLIEQVKPGVGDQTETASGGAAPLCGRPERLGDYRILGEVGRGGMGVVYEAEQESLGRRVALKVLSRRALHDEKALERFRREARSAARLHHTNIVPVFEVGHEGDVTFYAMQLIQGLGLDELVTELRRLRARSEPDGRSASGGDRTAGEGDALPDRLVSPLIHSLLTRHFEPARLAEMTPLPSPTDAREPTPSGAPPAAEPSSTHTYVSRDTEFPAVPSGPSRLSTTEWSRSHYYRSVARIGQQAAEALAYAHARGVVHRDVKPSNLLLDAEGVVWVTDFGLAKAEDDGLTSTGDILGTLRYMAPERFRGECDPRSDVYALGLTLYELLTLRPAFASADKLHLIERVKTHEPTRPRVLDPHIPRDLETITLKAIAKDPARRYQTAEELAADLRRFRENRPVRARRIGALGRAWRWAKRNPALAGTIGALALVFCTAFVTVTTLWRRSEHLRTVAEEQTGIATTAADDLRRQLYINRVNLAHREWLAGNVAVAIELLEQCPPDSLGFEWHYCMRLCHLDRITYRGHGDQGRAIAVLAIAFSPDGTRVASGGWDRTVRVWDAKSGRTLKALRGHELGVQSVAFSPDGARIASGGEDGTIRIWDVATGQVLRVLEGHDLWVFGVAFSPDGRRLVSCTGSHDPHNRREVDLWIWELSNGRVIRKLPGHEPGFGPIHGVAFSPDGLRIVSAGFHDLKVWDAATGKELAVLQGHQQLVTSVAFSPDGRFVASAAYDELVIVWDAVTGNPIRRFHGHAGWVEAVAFSPDGTRIASAGNDKTIRLWDVKTGREITTIRGHTDGIADLCFSPDGLRLASGADDGARLWNIDEAIEATSRSLGFHHGWANRATYSRDGRLLATSVWGIVRLWDVGTGRLVREINTGRAVRVDGLAFGSDDQSLWIGHEKHSDLMLVDVRTGRTTLYRTGHSGQIQHLASNREGRLVATASEDGTVRLFDATTGSSVRTLPGHKGGGFEVAFSPGGRLLASMAYDGAIRIWDIKSGAMVRRDLAVSPIRGVACGDCLTFSPDGRHLAAGSQDGTARIWDVESGRELRVLRGHSKRVNAVAYLGADGGRIVTGGEDHTIKLWDPTTGECIFTLRGHGGAVLGLACHPDGHQIVSGSGDQYARLWESTPWPTIRAHREALARVESLFRQGMLKGQVLRALRRDESLAEPDRQAAIAIAERIGETIERQVLAAWSDKTYREAIRLMKARDPKGALGASGRRVERWDEVVKERGDVPEYRKLLAAALSEHGHFLNRAGQRDEALRVHRRALEIGEALVREEDRGNDLKLLREVAHNLGTMAALERDAGQLPADTLAALRRMCERLERRSDLDSADFYNLACYHALTYRLAKSRPEGSAGMDTQEPPPIALDRAVVALGRAIDSGWTDADWTERDPDLAPLHDRDDYRQLIAELRDRTFPADPFAR